jgi:hypothetical protein
MVFSPLVKRQVPFLHVPAWRCQIKNGLLSGDRFVGHWCQNATPNLAPNTWSGCKAEMADQV